MIRLDNPHILYVSQKDPKAKFHSITQATQKATGGDQIIVGPGTYSSKTTQERFPIYVPPLCQLVGSGVNTCKIDGGGALQISTRPLNPYQSLVLLGDTTSLSGFTISNSGGNAISNEQGARFLVTQNTIKDNGQHGLLIFGANNAVVQNNYFKNNGTKRAEIGTPRWDDVAKQGHQIFIEGKSSVRNDVTIIGNKLEKTFADGIDAEIFDQPDGVEMNIRIIENIISECGRYGCCMAGSYGPSHAKMFVEIRNNQILKTTKTAIEAEAAISLVNNTIRGSTLHVNIIDNKIDDCNCGIDLIGAFSPSENSHVRYNVLGNKIKNVKHYGIRAISGIGMDEWPVKDTNCQIIIANNKLSMIKKESIFVQGGIGIDNKSGQNYVRNNRLLLDLFGNHLGSKGKIIINDGLCTNHVIVSNNSQSHVRKHTTIPYDVT